MMDRAHPDLLLTTSPFIKDPTDTRWIMWQVNLALLPVTLAAVWYYGLASILILTASILGAVGTEAFLKRKIRNLPGGLSDGSAVLTGWLIGLTLPPSVPLWIAFAGGVISIGLGKAIFGGIGGNMFNPALVGRAFLQAAFPVALTTWPAVEAAGRFTSAPGTLFAPPFLSPAVDGISSATPLARMAFDNVQTSNVDLLLGSTTGSLGEAAAGLILLAGIYLAARRVLNWRIPVSILASAFLFGGILYLVDPTRYPSPEFHLFAGGLMLGAVFMATDPVTSPLTQKGCWIFGFGIGVLVVLIRQFGGLPEGVMYAILFMNAATPLIDRLTQARTFGSEKPERFTR